ncbi:MAG: hypothetical protein FD161_3172 [Limisphaerales bacterium]|nr:MAG: hypothetical protein FD161_3172 [Limisphaerales bacterium]KAG0507964.1 MAG: hypothetical protein E1N63_2838 [Limisphaerales bacterium]TXT43636.1 MAG: hypothetical protein FD140_4952 [Limisphaerales bacterium]
MLWCVIFGPLLLLAPGVFVLMMMRLPPFLVVLPLILLAIAMPMLMKMMSPSGQAGPARTVSVPPETMPAAGQCCDVCEQPLAQGSGHLLVTTEVVSSQRFWARFWKLHHQVLRSGVEQWRAGLGGVVNFATFAMQFRQFTQCHPAIHKVADNETPWLVCPKCLGKFRAQPGATRADAESWWSSGGVLQPKGTGAAAHDDVDLGGFKPVLALFLLIFCVLFSLLAAMLFLLSLISGANDKGGEAIAGIVLAIMAGGGWALWRFLRRP